MLRNYVVTLVLLCCTLVVKAADPLTPITMQIRWLHQFQFAGYYAAVHKGFYAQKGLDVTIVAGSPSRNPVSEVLAGRAQYGEANSELLYHYLQGEPLVALAAIFQHSPSILLARKDSGIRTPQDMIGKRVMMVGGTEDVDFLAMLANEGVSRDSVNIIPSSYNIHDLISGKTDLFNAYVTNEPFFLQEQGVEASVIEPINYGIDFYSDILFTTREEINHHPERVAAFREATIQGWEYAMSHTEEIIDLLLSEQYQSQKSRAHLQYEAETMQQLILPTLIPVGNMNPGRLQRMATVLAQFDLAPAKFSLEDFIYDPNPSVNLGLFIQVVSAISVLMLLIAIVASKLWKLNHRLSKEIAQHKITEANLTYSEQHFRQIINNLQDVYYSADINGTILTASPSALETFGYSPEEVVGTNMADYYAPPFSREDFLKQLAAANGKLKGYQLQMKLKDGSHCWVSVNSQYVLRNGNVIGVEGTIRDITELKMFQEKCLLMALHDSLTGLPNRRHLLDILERAISVNKRRGHFGALIYIDLDYFKPVNDRYGHAVGDQLLIAVAERLNHTTRKEDTVSRIGGDEFIILMATLTSSQIEDAKQESKMVAEKIREELERPFAIGIHSFTISASVGISLFPTGEHDADRVIELADAAMYQSKNRGRNITTFSS